MNKSANQDEDNDTNMLLKASPKRLFETLMEQTADRIYIKDRKSRFIAVSQALADLHQYTNREDLEGMTDFDFFSNECAQQAYDDEQEILRTGVPITNRIKKETWSDGSITWASSSKAPLHLSSGKIIGTIGISRDVTSEKIAQEQLKINEQRLREQNEIMRSDYESAKKVQSVMIPGRLPPIPSIHLAYLWKPMASVGGDMINFPRNPEQRLLFFMADVCGHGVSAAFYTVLIKYLTAHAAEEYNDDPQQFLTTVNNEITGRINKGFVTGLAGHFSSRKEDGSRTLHLSHAGHRQVLIYRKATAAIELINLPIGVVMGIPGSEASENKTIDLHRDDRFYAFTDGIVEASDPEGEEFGMKRLIENFETLSTRPIQETIDSIYDIIAKFTQSPDQQDDITILGFELE